ncbi:MAG: hypothetical protein U0797_00875 [Gemmataceae bacterium]
MRHLLLSLAILAGVSAGCAENAGPGGGAKEGVPAAGPAPTASVDGKKLMIDAEPPGAKGVIEVRKDSKDGDEVVVAGQVGGHAKPFTEGRASFLIADASLKPTDGCDTPWDFCELPKKEVAAARLNVRFVDGGGNTVKTGARELFGLKELTQVVVKGTLKRDDKDNVSVVASAIYVRPAAK